MKYLELEKGISPQLSFIFVTQNRAKDNPAILLLQYSCNIVFSFEVLEQIVVLYSISYKIQDNSPWQGLCNIVFNFEVLEQIVVLYCISYKIQDDSPWQGLSSEELDAPLF